jgi:hypothetical protein
VFTGKICWAVTVAIRTIATLIRLFKTSIVARRCLGPSFSLGSLRSLKTFLEDEDESSFNELMSVGFREKKATSDPEISALKKRRTEISPAAM